MVGDRQPARRVLVTGASRGIGRAVALAMADHGDRIALHHRDSQSQVDAVLAELDAPADGTSHVVVQGDLSDPQQAEGVVAAAAAGLGGLDVLVNNAGVFLEHRLDGLSYAEWQRVWRQTLDLNLLGPANVTFCALEHLRRGRQPRVVNVSSRGAFRGEREAPAYGASKAGLNAFAQSMALALAADGIAVSVVAPGFVETDMAQAALKPPRGDEIKAQSPFGRVARADEVAAAVLYLASPEAQFSSGAVLDVNGASYLRT